jgi:hypothetical protein
VFRAVAEAETTEGNIQDLLEPDEREAWISKFFFFYF